ncbi:PepSY-associated TM helix domain-containing protein [Sphingobacterium hungaricum]|uniref:PepSY domain-containing protein n=1 Tax=Sphingobacterium hungaricum TaxID=2082723 RepID=A0A928YQR8_9SPHI|nr:PepSY-associated TM helix domain-containing protein [Sphingobacterium hungaricum]MBE8713862.1 PepSY domain-containing protein [Sphingobacterium hungaricum]
MRRPIQKRKSKKSRFRKISDWLHLWLGLASGLVVVFLGVTGCIFAFQKEISELIDPKAYFVEAPKHAQALPLSVLTKKAEEAFGQGIKVGFSTTYPDPNKTWEFGAYKEGNADAFWYFDAVDYYVMAYVNPYTGEVTKSVDYKYEFFNVVKMLHWSFLINHPIGQQIIGWSTFIFVILMITGIIMWWPKNLNKSNTDKSFTIKWKAKFKRINYDLHNVLGFYSVLICMILALTGMVWAFTWFYDTVYVVASASTKEPTLFYAESDTATTKINNAYDLAFAEAKKLFAHADRISMSPADGGTAVIYATGYQGDETYWDYDVIQFDQYSGKLLHRRNQSEKNNGEVLLGMNYDIHVGAVLGLPGKMLVFSASLIASSLPITGFIIWWGKRKKKKPRKPAQTV